MDAPTAPIVATAPDATAAPVTLTATEHAATTGDMGAFRAASRAERAGKPLPAVEPVETKTTAEPAATVAAEPKLSRREREQNEANERTQKAVDLATADLRKQLEELRTAAPRAETKTEPADKGTPAWKRYAQMPGAPKLTDMDPKTGSPVFESVEEHSAAMAVFIQEQRDAERSTTERTSAESEALTAAQQARVGNFIKQLQDTQAADPTFRDKLTPEVKALKPFGGLQPGEASGPRNIIAEQIYDSPIAPKVLVHLSEHPEVLTRLDTMPPSIAALPPAIRIRAHIQWIVREFGKLEGSLESPSVPTRPQTKTLTDATTTETLGERSTEPADASLAAAVKGDMGAFRRAEKAKRAAQGLKT